MIEVKNLQDMFKPLPLIFIGLNRGIYQGQIFGPVGVVYLGLAG
jgi:hypothetical protein